MSLQLSDTQKRIDEVEKSLSHLPQGDYPLTHEFTDKFYIRTITVPADQFIISKIHKTDSAFCLSKGEITIWDENNNEQRITAPFWGVTKAPNRRVGLTHSEVIWTTFHRTDTKNPLDAEKECVYDRELIDTTKMEYLV